MITFKHNNKQPNNNNNNNNDNPTITVIRYEWLKEQEEEEAAHRLAMGKMPKKQKLLPAIEAFKIPKSEIVHVLKTPLSMLSRKDVMVRKLMVK